MSPASSASSKNASATAAEPDFFFFPPCSQREDNVKKVHVEFTVSSRCEREKLDDRGREFILLSYEKGTAKSAAKV